MRIFKTRWFARFARRQGVADRSLVEAVARAGRGLVDADLGGGIIKQRVARAGQGRSGGHRMLIAYRVGDRAVFLYGFAKNERDNIEPNELLTCARSAGPGYARPRKIDQAIADQTIEEVRNGKEERD